MKSKAQNYNTDKQNEELFDIKRILFLSYKYWYLLVLSGIIGIGVAYTFNIFQQSQYVVSTKIIVPQRNNELNFEGMFSMNSPQNMTNSVNNDIEILKSIKLNKRVAKELNWRTFWHQKRKFQWYGLYNECPFLVVENVINPEDIKVFVTVLDDKTYNVTVQGEGIYPTEVTKTLKFGVSFKSNNFDFNLILRPGFNIQPGNEYYFEFKNVENVAVSFMKYLRVELAEERGEIVTLSMISYDKNRGIDYLNKLTDVFIDLKLEHETVSQKKSISFLSDQLAGISDSLYISENTFTNFRSKNQVIDLSQQGSIILSSLNELDVGKTNVEMQLEYFRKLQQYLQDNTEIDKIVSPSVVGIADQSFISLVQQMIDLIRKRNLLVYSSKENNPQRQLVNQEILQVKRLLNENLTNLIENAENNLNLLDKRYQQTSVELNTLPEKEQQLLNIQREYQITSDIYTYMLEKKAETELSLAATTVDIIVVDEASNLTTKVTGRSLVKNYILGLIVGLMIPFFIITIRDFLNNKVRNKLNLQNISTLPVVGSLMHSKETGYLQVKKDPASLLSEAFRSLRINIKFLLSDQNEKVIGVNSALSGEGKTFVAVNLATVYALADKRTLIIGCDMRRPKLAAIFKLSNSKGLSNILTNDKTFEEVVKSCSVENLFVIPSGPIPPNPLELLERENFKKLLEWAKMNFDYIILDNPPSLMVSDGIVSSKQCDLNLFVVRAGQTQIDLIEGINNVVAESFLKNPCFVVNDQTLSDFGYGYRYNYNYNYKYNYYQSENKQKEN